MERQAERIRDLIERLESESRELENDVRELIRENTDPAEFERFTKELNEIESQLQRVLGQIDSLTRRV